MSDKISITICGDGGCGKSSITLRLVRSEWVNEYDPTIEDSYSVTRTIDGIPYFLSITDTAGQEEYRGLWASSNLKSDAFLLVYDITNADSLTALDHFIDMIDLEADQREEDNYRLLSELGASAKGVDVGMPPPVKIIAGNKCDLKDARVVSARDGLEYARKHGCGFMETSARDMVNIEETFALLVRRVVEARQLHYGQGTILVSASRQAAATGSGGGPTTTETKKNATNTPSAKPTTTTQRQSSGFLGLGKSLLKRASNFNLAKEASQADEKEKRSSKDEKDEDEDEDDDDSDSRPPRPRQTQKTSRQAHPDGDERTKKSMKLEDDSVPPDSGMLSCLRCW